MSTGIPYREWAQEDERILWTAFRLAEERERETKRAEDREGKAGDFPVMSG